MTPVLACSDCYAESAAPTYVLLGSLATAALVALLFAVYVGRRRGLTPRGALAASGVVVTLVVVGLAFPAAQVGGSRLQPGNAPYRLVCGSAIHASLQRWTAPSADPGEAGDERFCAHWAAVNLGIGEGLLALGTLTALGFLAICARRRTRPAATRPLPAT